MNAWWHLNGINGVVLHTEFMCQREFAQVLIQLSGGNLAAGPVLTALGRADWTPGGARSRSVRACAWRPSDPAGQLAQKTI